MFTAMVMAAAMFIYLAPRILQGPNQDEEGQHHLHEAGQIQEDVDPFEDQFRDWGKDLFGFIVCFISTPIGLYLLYVFWRDRSAIMCRITGPDQTGQFQCQRYS